MRDRLELETALDSIRGAFKPLRCTVEDWDYRQKVRFRVFSPNDEPLLRVDEALASRVCDPEGLSFIVSEARARLQSRGYTLEPWNPPSL